MQGRGEKGKKEKEERMVWVGAKDGGDAWESWKSPHGQTFLSVYPLTVQLSRSRSQRELTDGGPRHRTNVAG